MTEAILNDQKVGYEMRVQRFTEGKVRGLLALTT
jgi:hypothetical protein